MKKVFFTFVLSLLFILWVNAESVPTLYNNEELDAVICTMEYAPVCAIVQIQCITTPCYPILQTFSNSCMAQDNEIIYNWECDIKLSDNDFSFYNSIKNSKLEIKYQDKVYEVLGKYKTLLSKKSLKKQIILNELILKKIDDYLNIISKEYPQDSILPKDINIKYLKLKLLKFEILIIK